MRHSVGLFSKGMKGHKSPLTIVKEERESVCHLIPVGNIKAGKPLCSLSITAVVNGERPE